MVNLLLIRLCAPNEYCIRISDWARGTERMNRSGIEARIKCKWIRESIFVSHFVAWRLNLNKWQKEANEKKNPIKICRNKKEFKWRSEACTFQCAEHVTIMRLFLDTYFPVGFLFVKWELFYSRVYARIRTFCNAWMRGWQSQKRTWRKTK